MRKRCFFFILTKPSPFFSLFRPFPFFPLFSVVRPTQISAFLIKKKVRRRQWRQWHIISNNCHFNLKDKEFFALQTFSFSLFLFEFNNDVDFSFLHCRDVDFVTTPCCFQAPRILCWGTGPPSSRLLLHSYFIVTSPMGLFNLPILFLFFFFLFRPTDPKSDNAFDNKQGWP